MDEAAIVVCGHWTESINGLASAIEDRGWSPVVSTEIDRATEHPALVEAGPALVSLDGDEPPDPRRLEALIGSSRREWIALLPPHRDSAELLGNHCVAQCLFAHHRLPGDVEALDTLLQHAAGMARLRQTIRNRARDQQCDPHASHDSEMVGTAPGMLRLFERIRKAAPVEAPVLIRGESGTGKELAAHALHERSARSQGPFIAVNCGALPGELIQSELFGHEKGAFTGAVQQHEGRIEAASGGTLFLDEIGDLPLELQANLLRFLQSGVIQRVGSTHEIPVDVRILSATRVCLEDAVSAGTFREDLYHRLNVLPIDIPPLRDRPEDIEVLAGFFFDRFRAERGPGLAGISRNALHVMRHYEWPGNVRELINRMRRAMVMAEGRLLQPEDLGLERRGMLRYDRTLEEAREHAEREAIRAALARNRQSVTRAADDLGVSRMTLYRLLDKYDLRELRTA